MQDAVVFIGGMCFGVFLLIMVSRLLTPTQIEQLDQDEEEDHRQLGFRPIVTQVQPLDNYTGEGSTYVEKPPTTA